MVGRLPVGGDDGFGDQRAVPTVHEDHGGPKSLFRDDVAVIVGGGTTISPSTRRSIRCCTRIRTVSVRLIHPEEFDSAGRPNVPGNGAIAEKSGRISMS